MKKHNRFYKDPKDGQEAAEEVADGTNAGAVEEQPTVNTEEQQ